MVQTSGQLATLVAQTKSTKLQPHSFFVAWRGVMTLAFSGFPNELVGLKERIQANLGSVLPPENMGSKWPKMTLGALNEGKVLTQKEFDELSTLCTQMSQNLALLSDDFPVTNVSFVVFGCRTLERLLIRADMALAANEGDDDVSQEQIEKVESVLKEQEDKDVYLKEVQKLGHRVK
ncbi:hypothetical protein HDU99_010503 [Rhizoclosmatium hyalinum]|nr:hypothetical protein HDU99_010503 [Rhizoclosmatium hyalinum]